MKKQNVFKIGIAAILLVIVAMITFGKSPVKTTDILVGQGDSAKGGRSLMIDYEAFVFDESKPEHKGAKFDSTFDRHQPSTLKLGEHTILRGLEKGLYGMKAGGRRIIEVPANLGYGKDGAGGGLVPPNAKLLYIVDLRAILP